MSFTIRSVELYQCPVRLSRPFIISLGSLTHAENFFVVIHTSEGPTGYGEGSPFRTIHGETMETCFVTGKEIAQLLKGKTFETPAEAVGLMDRFLFANKCMKSAFDMAVNDIASQMEGVPLFKYLGGETSKLLETDYTVSLSDTVTMAADAKWILKEGFAAIKVKLGGKPEDDFERIRKIREAIGYDLPMRIDANQGWTVKEAVEILKDLSQFNIQHCEEPVSRNLYTSLPEIRSASPVPLMADESCCTVHDANRLIALEACDGFNIKLSKSGGIVHAKEIVSLAKEAKLKLQAGGFLESRLGFTAIAHLAVSEVAIEYIDFDTPLMMTDDPVEGGIKYEAGGRIRIPESPGLGATLNAELLKRLSVAEWVI